jgi:hypothetical protein
MTESHDFECMVQNARIIEEMGAVTKCLRFNVFELIFIEHWIKNKTDLCELSAVPTGLEDNVATQRRGVNQCEKRHKPILNNHVCLLVCHVYARSRFPFDDILS